ncbi:MAG: J domain-containing protein [Phycisphaerales bacterium]|nr:J domain-containing protein [Phycisphaerales bacterium]
MLIARQSQLEPLDEFVRRVWRDDVAPLLRDRRAVQRKATARTGGRVAASAGLLLDGVLGLRGKPFTRFMTVLGTSVGAMVPDLLDWKWLGEFADEADRQTVDQQVQRRAAELDDRAALELFGLTPVASLDALKSAWRAAAQRWHPDKARSPQQSAEYRIAFIAYQTAYEELCRAYEIGRLPHHSSAGG